MLPTQTPTNESGFSGLPAGNRNAFGKFQFIGDTGGWWSKTETNKNNAFNSYLLSFESMVSGGFIGGPKQMGLSIRCIKD
jgi:uncharacterized protein (TIGR02145 family)